MDYASEVQLLPPHLPQCMKVKAAVLAMHLNSSTRSVFNGRGKV